MPLIVKVLENNTIIYSLKLLIASFECIKLISYYGNLKTYLILEINLIFPNNEQDRFMLVRIQDLTKTILTIKLIQKAR